MKRTTVITLSSLMVITGIVAVAVLWWYFNQNRLLEGRLLFILWSGHGIHTLDLAFAAVELVLLSLLTMSVISLITGDR